MATQRDGEVLQSEITKNSMHIVWGDYFKIFMHVDKQNEKIVFTVAELLVFLSLSLSNTKSKTSRAPVEILLYKDVPQCHLSGCREGDVTVKASEGQLTPRHLTENG